MYIVTKIVAGKETKVLTADSVAEAQYVVTALKANGVMSASYRRKVA